MSFRGKPTKPANPEASLGTPRAPKDVRMEIRMALQMDLRRGLSCHIQTLPRLPELPVLVQIAGGSTDDFTAFFTWNAWQLLPHTELPEPIHISEARTSEGREDLQPPPNPYAFLGASQSRMVFPKQRNTSKGSYIIVLPVINLLAASLVAREINPQTRRPDQ